MVVDNAVCSDEFAGVIRQEDVRGWEVDKVKIEEMFRVGDVVRAVVVSSFFLIFLFTAESTELVTLSANLICFVCHGIRYPWATKLLIT